MTDDRKAGQRDTKREKVREREKRKDRRTGDDHADGQETGRGEDEKERGPDQRGQQSPKP